MGELNYKVSTRVRNERTRRIEVLGDSRPDEQIKPEWRKYFDRLVDLHERLQQERETQFRDALAEAPSFSMHPADAGTDSYDRDMALGMLSQEQDALYEIEEALNRIRDGSYGTCELTGKKISRERLDAIPWTRFCAPAERSLEEKGEIHRARLGAREGIRRENPSGAGDESP